MTVEDLLRSGMINQSDLDRLKEYEAKKQQEEALKAQQEDKLKWLRKYINIDFDASGLILKAITGQNINVADRVKINITPEGKKALGLIGLGLTGLIYFIKKR